MIENEGLKNKKGAKIRAKKVYFLIMKVVRLA